MRFPIFVFLAIIICFSCKQEDVITYDEVVLKFNETSNSIQKLSYNVRRIDSFPSRDGGAINVWDNNGSSLIEINNKDEVFGFNFYGKMNNKPFTTIYDQGNVFYLDDEEKTYEQDKGGYFVLGSPGGQMVSTSFFKLDSIFETIKVTPNKLGYKINYTFADDTVYLVTNRIKIVQLNEEFIPIHVRTSSYSQGEKQTGDYVFTDIKVNDAVSENISEKKMILASYEKEVQEESLPSPLLNKKLPELIFKDIVTDANIKLNTDKLLLIDFWEIWCGWCIKAFPKVDALNNTYSKDLQIIGVVTESRDKAIEMIEAKHSKISHGFMDKSILDKFQVNSFPRYFLVDKKGIVRKEYFGFSENIENDIKSLINETK
ncbi:TlpA disulfide reductase family protein [Ichthyenterobacterium sp. W332]|uniref:TlpA disulfide reductase family protein n=1 Tax=Microcosmobacter mediterraneus TaxID=3075607 RepID=A0ABU2YFV3_9FLAO|nr:TlpA disulfide reductase family protein [Ichthyenterobacterium sp. W332]MDT0557063.1 TlpA disulfide reductase family protein [Ichthyenterobacterium sp. W332]